MVSVLCDTDTVSTLVRRIILRLTLCWFDDSVASLQVWKVVGGQPATYDRDKLAGENQANHL